MTQPIFLHGLFRSGSTYFFDKLRSSNAFWCYYEPFHHVIAKLDPDDIDIWSHSDRTSKRMNHPTLSRPHFYEYSTCFKGADVSFFDKRLSYDRFFAEKASGFDLEKNYIDHLIASTPEGLVPVLQFNRTTLRLQNFVEAYPEAKHIYLLRSPRHQFQSYVTSGPIFLALNLLISSRLLRAGYQVPVSIPFFEDENIDKEIGFYISRLVRFSPSQHYEVFLSLWLGSYLCALESGCTILDVDLADAKRLSQVFCKDVFGDLDFSDYKVRSKSAFFLLQKEVSRVENESIASCKDLLNSLGSIGNLPIDCIDRQGDYEFSFGLRLEYYRKLLKSIIYRSYFKLKFRVLCPLYRTPSLLYRKAIDWFRSST